MKKRMISLAVIALFAITGILGAAGSGNKSIENEAPGEASAYYDLAGKVTDSKTGEPLPGVRLIAEEGRHETYTGFDGFFRFDTPVPANTSILVEYISYKGIKFDLGKVEEEELHIELEQ